MTSSVSHGFVPENDENWHNCGNSCTHLCEHFLFQAIFFFFAFFFFFLYVKGCVYVCYVVWMESRGIWNLLRELAGGGRAFHSDYVYVQRLFEKKSEI